MKKTLILSALVEEQNYYFQHLKINRTEKIGFVTVSIVQTETTALYLALTGMGTTNAALVLGTLATAIDFDAIFFSGTCGGIAADLKIGDVVIVDDAFDADIFTVHDEVQGTPFEPALIHPHKQEMTPRFYPATLKNLINIEMNFPIYNGRAATSNHFPSPPAFFEIIKAQHAVIIDMETSVIYQYAWLTNTPCLVVRGVSNLLNEAGGDDHAADADVSSADHAAAVTLAIIENMGLRS